MFPLESSQGSSAVKSNSKNIACSSVVEQVGGKHEETASDLSAPRLVSVQHLCYALFSFFSEGKCVLHVKILCSGDTASSVLAVTEVFGSQ